MSATECHNLPREVLREAFKFLADEEVDVLCPYLDIREWPANSIVMPEGDLGDFMGILVEGKLAVHKKSDFPGRHILMAVLEPGSLVGEMSVAERGSRNSSVIAMEPSKLFVLTSDNFEALMSENQALGIKLLKRIIHVLSLRFRNTNDRLARLL